MYQSKAIQLIKLFTGKECRNFLVFLKSPQLKNSEELVALGELLVSYYPKFDSPELDRVKLFNKLYRNEPYQEKKLPYLFTDLVKHIEAYLVQLYVHENESVYDHILLKVYYERNAEKYFKQTLEAQQKKEEGQLAKKIGYYFHQYEINQMANALVLNKTGHSSGDLLKRSLNMLDQFYFQEKLRSANMLFNYSDIHANEYEVILIRQIVEACNEIPFNTIPTLQAYKATYSLLTEENNNVILSELQDFIQENEDKISFDYLREIYGYIRNHHVINTNTGQSKNPLPLFELLKILIEKNYLLENGFLSPWDYQNMVITAIRCGELDYAYNFINSYRELLDPIFKGPSFHLNMAYYYFAQKDYSKTLQYVNKVDSNDDNFVLSIKVLTIKTYYELEEFVPLFYLFDSFYIFLKRNKSLSNQHKSRYLNFIKYIKKVAKIKLGSKTSAMTLKDEINEKKQSVDMRWLNFKLDELIEKDK